MKPKSIFACCTAAASLCAMAAPAQAEDYHYTGQIMLLAANYCPADSMQADGTALEIANNHFLYSLIGDRFNTNPELEPGNFQLPKLTAPTGLIYCIVVNGPYPRRA